MDYYTAVRAFLSSAEASSFSKAAQQLGIKTSTVSRYIGQLEADLGIALFNRSTRGLVLTEGGTVFREHALISLQALDDARNLTSSLNQTPQGHLRVTMPVAFGRRHIVRHLPQFLARYPDISIDAVITDDVVNLIDSGIDLAIRIGALADSQLMARKLAEHQRVVCASPDYVAQHGAPAMPEELASHEALRFSLATDDRWLLVNRETNAARASGPAEIAVRLQGALRANDTESILSLAVAGRGVALLPSWSVSEALKAGELVHLLPDWQAQVGRNPAAIWAIYPPKKKVSSKVRAFVDFYAEILSAPGYWGA
ncbi:MULTISPECIES: LysR family transcriptional regulator [Pandoraea]|uniref:LysR family transcriptional regulator n=1 Tax=Pandoraea TaxID=93217 RepID=UPI001F5D0AE4|nr:MULTISPECIES: LysR family transcriptional regulator [Pandoraea]MCI3206381.1 LysR family transcriptional regulator [Pandoraea sp. LA3]MDN4584409.1 LysR family transcriptional regulator [Pandoraea capi]